MSFDYAPPKYAQVVAEIQRRISEGEYAPGTLLPSEHQLVADFRGVPADDRQGAVVAAAGRVDRDSAGPGQSRARAAGAGRGTADTPGGERAGAARDGADRRARAGRVKLAPAYVTTLLGLEPGAKAFLRQRLLSEDDGTPVELASIWLPLELAAGTDLASPELLGESIRHHLQARKKVRLDHAVERISARKPTGEEAALLGVAADAPVLNVIVTAYDATARPVQVTDLVLPGDRHEIHDAYPFA